MTPSVESTTSLQPVLRLIHCIQRERGASCALAGSHTSQVVTTHQDDVHIHHVDVPASSPPTHQHPYRSNVRSARTATNSAISSFYHSSGQNGQSNIAAALYQIRQIVDGDIILASPPPPATDGINNDDAGDPNNDGWSFHRVVKEFSTLLSYIIQTHVVDTVNSRRKGINDRSEESTESSLLGLLLSFVTLKESLGLERATLSGLMAAGKDVKEIYIESKSVDGGTSHDISDPPRLPIILNDLVMVVENQHRILMDLEQQTGICIKTGNPNPSDEDNETCSTGLDPNLIRLIAESIKLSDAMKNLQDHIRNKFDVSGFQKARR